MAKNTARAEAFMTQRGVKWDGRLLKLGGHSQPRVLVSEGDGSRSAECSVDLHERFEERHCPHPCEG